MRPEFLNAQDELEYEQRFVKSKEEQEVIDECLENARLRIKLEKKGL